MNVSFNIYCLQKMKIFIKIIIFLLIIIWWLYLSMPQLFKYNKDYSNKKINIKDYVLTPDVWKIYLLNLKLLSFQKFWFNGIQAGTQLYFDAIDTFNTNIIDLFDNTTSNKKIILNTYIKQLQKLQAELWDTINNLQNNYNEEQVKTQEYLQQKQSWDSNFNEGFKVKDNKMVVEGIKTSYENGPKYIKHRILSNAWKIVISKLEKIKTLIDAKLILLQDNTDTIVNNYSIIKWDLLWKLVELKKRLELNRYN